MKHEKLRVPTLLLAVWMLIVSIPVTAHSVMVSSDSECIELTEDSIGALQEITSKREANVKHYQKPDGSYVAIVYDGIVHKKDSAGEWQDIDNRMAEFARGKSNVYATADGRVSFNKELNQKGKTIYDINDGHYQVTVSLDESSINSASVKLSNHSAKYMPSASDSMDVQYNKIKEIDNNTILLYNEVMQGVSFEYILSANDVKENIIINKPTSKYEYSFIYELSGLEAMLADTGDVLLCDEVSGAIVYEIPAPFMFDSNNAVSNEVAYKLKELQKGTYQLTVTANPDWLNDESRVYPVVIDPTLNFRAAVSDTYIDYSNPDTNYGRAADLWVSNSKVTYLTSGLLPTLADNMTITHAEMTVYYEYHITSGYLDLGLYVCNQPWIFSSLTWNSANGYSHLGTFESSLATARAQASTTSSISTVTFDVTKAYQAWFAGLPYYGVALKRVGGTNYSVIIKAAEAGTATRAMCVLEYTLEDDLPLEEGTYFFENAKLGKYMQIDDNSNPSDVGAFLELWEFDGELYQQWDITYLHNGYYRISSKASGLSLKPPSSLNQSITQENLDYFDESFYWSVVKQSNGCYKISPKSHSTYYMAASFGILVENGRNVEMRSNIQDQKDEWVLICNSGTDATLLGIKDTGHDHATCYGEIMPIMSQRGYLKFNCVITDAISRDTVEQYMQESRVFISRSHGNKDLLGTFIILAEDNTQWIHSDQIFDFSNNSPILDLSNCDLLLFVGCYTATSDQNNLPSAATKAGATAAIGFEESIGCERANDWVEYFTEYYTKHFSVALSAYNAASDCNNQGNVDSYEIFYN